MTTTKASVSDRTGRAGVGSWAGIVPVLLIGAFAACGPGSGGSEADAGGPGTPSTLNTPDASPDAMDARSAPDTSLPIDAGMQAAQPNQTCTVAAQCATGFCVDGVCCDKACDGTCESCAVTGKAGTCSPIRNAADDLCGADSTCDDTGACRKLLGKACAISGECASGYCVDGVCCNTTACGDCQSCAVAGWKGSCTAVPRFTDDADSNCSSNRTCDGVGQCRFKDGTSCTQDAQCASLHCVDGICCDDACTSPGVAAGTCRSCTEAGRLGLCTEVRCKFEDGAPCKSDADCINGSCLTSYRDADGDGYGGAMVVRCERAPALGYVTAGGDCCDSDPATHPGVTTFSSASNACHGFDRNCDGKVERSDGSTATCGCFGPTGGKLAGQICTSCR